MKLTAETTLKGIAIAIGALVALMAAMELQHALEDERADRPMAVSDDPLREMLQRCRSLTPDALEADTACQAAWAENRRRFFGAPSNDQGTD